MVDNAAPGLARRPAFLTVVLCILVMSMADPTHGRQKWGGTLEGTPLSKFTDEDVELFEAARLEALEERPEASQVGWSNPDSGNSGTVTPIKTEDRGGQRCRELRIVNRAGDKTGDSRIWFCKQPDGTWKVP